MKKYFLLFTLIALSGFVGCKKEDQSWSNGNYVSSIDAPEGLTVTRLGNAIRISWDRVSNASEYVLDRGRSKQFNYDVADTSGIVWNDAVLIDGTDDFIVTTSYTYVIDDNPHDNINYYRVKALASNGLESEYCKYVYIDMSDNDSNSDDSDTDQGNNGAGGGLQQGMYMGIIGFNDRVNIRNISFLSDYVSIDNKDVFQNFVNTLEMRPATGLYYSVDSAINILQSAVFPSDLVNVYMITFTDGLDNVSIDLNPKYNSRDAYRDAIKNRIATQKVNNIPITAYSIGVAGSDVVDIDAFRDGLSAIASDGPNYTKEVSSMDEVNSTFREIASSLVNVNQMQDISLQIPGGYDDSTKIRFTFDYVSEANYSDMYIEGVYRREGNSRYLEDVNYVGLKCSNEGNVGGIVSDNVYVTFSFKNIKRTDTDNMVSTDYIKQWEYLPAQSRWQPNSEFDNENAVAVEVNKQSAVIMLVLDCTSSLNNSGFVEMKRAVNNFISALTE